MFPTADTKTHPRMLRAQTIVKRTKAGFRTHMGNSASSEITTDSNAGIRVCLDELCTALQKLVGNGLEDGLHKDLSEMLMNELAPYLGSVPLVAALMAHEDGQVITERAHLAMVHEGIGTTSTDVIDAWLRSLPSMNAFAEVPDACMKVTGRMADRVVDGPIWVIGADHPRVSMGLQQAGGTRKIIPIEWAPPNEFSPEAESPALIVVPGLLEAVPDRYAIRLLSSLRLALLPGGRMVASALGPSDDSAFADLVLGWPTHRRSPAQLLDLFILSGLAIVSDVPSPKPGLVVIAQDKSDAMSSSSETKNG